MINTKNPFGKTGAAARTTIKQLFLKGKSQWPNGKVAKPYARRATSSEQAAFQKSLLGMKDSELARHWLRIKNLNGQTPPKAVGSDRLLLKFVARHEGAFGVVRRSAVKGNSKVRVLFKL
ncbi:MAG: hypothetical protein NXI31_00920 [bacterium]|nr:hypothetical protein [bacterium]